MLVGREVTHSVEQRGKLPLLNPLHLCRVAAQGRQPTYKPLILWHKISQARFFTAAHVRHSIWTGVQRSRILSGYPAVTARNQAAACRHMFRNSACYRLISSLHNRTMCSKTAKKYLGSRGYAPFRSVTIMNHYIKTCSRLNAPNIIFNLLIYLLLLNFKTRSNRIKARPLPLPRSLPPVWKPTEPEPDGCARLPGRGRRPAGSGR
jgi:hypothetical protein